MGAHCRTEQRSTLSADEVASDALVVLRSIGRSVVSAAEHHPDDLSLRRAAAMYVSWRDLPADNPEDTGDRYSRGDTEPPTVPIKPDTLLVHYGHHTPCEHGRHDGTLCEAILADADVGAQ